MTPDPWVFLQLQHGFVCVNTWRSRPAVSLSPSSVGIKVGSPGVGQRWHGFRRPRLQACGGLVFEVPLEQSPSLCEYVARRLIESCHLPSMVSATTRMNHRDGDRNFIVFGQGVGSELGLARRTIRVQQPRIQMDGRGDTRRGVRVARRVADGGELAGEPDGRSATRHAEKFRDLECNSATGRAKS